MTSYNKGECLKGAWISFENSTATTRGMFCIVSCNKLIFFLLQSSQFMVRPKDAYFTVKSSVVKFYLVVYISDA